MLIDHSEIAAYWGAVISTVLGLIKLREVYLNRIRLLVSYSFTSDPTRGNEIQLANPSNVPVMVQNWKLLWVKKRRLRKDIIKELTFDDEPELCGINIGAHSRHSIYFQDQDHFEWGFRTKAYGKLYIQVFIVEKKRPTTLLVYDPNT